MFKKILKRVGEINPLDDATMERLLVKAMEELGELAEAINWKNNYKRTDKSINEISDAITEESIDVLVCIFAIMEKNNTLPDDADNYLKKKLKKWERNLLQKQKNNTIFVEHKN